MSKKEKKKAGPVYLIPVLVGFFLLSAVLAVYFFLVTQNDKKEDLSNQPVRVLMLGNDYMVINDVPDMVRQIFGSSGIKRPVEIKSIALPDGRYGIAQHLQSQGFEKLTDKTSRWDFVVLQDSPEKILNNPYEVLKDIRAVKGKLKGAGTRFVFMMPWASFQEKTRQKVISAVVGKMANNLSLRVAPAGDLIFRVQERYPDFKLYMDDNRMASADGAWIAAASIYSVLTGEAPTSGRAEVFYAYGMDKKKRLLSIPENELEGVCRMVFAGVREGNRGHRLSLQKGASREFGVLREKAGAKGN